MTQRRAGAARRWLGVVGWCALALLVGWGAGLVWFIRVADRTLPVPTHVDGIVALTGGADRIETALRLLAAGRAEWLLVSGIGPGPDMAALARRSGVDAAILTPRVELGRQATSTRGNATETAAWVRSKGIHSLIVVTAWYHMPRALTELARAMPDVTLYPAPVVAERSHVSDLAVARLLMEEYTKYLGARMNLSALWPERSPASPRGAHP